VSHVRRTTHTISCGLRLLVALCVVGSGICPSDASAAPGSRIRLPPLLPATQAWLLSLPAPPSAGGCLDDARVYIPLSSKQVVALDRETGSTAWSRELDTEWPAAIAGDTLLIVAKDELHAVEAKSGEPRWRVALPGRPMAAIHVAGALGLMVSEGGGITAFRIEDGSEAWRISTTFGDKPPAIATDETAAYVTLAEGRVASFALEDGRMRWEQTLPGTLSPPAVARERVFVGSTDNSLYALDSESGKFEWRMRAGGDVIGAAVANDVVYYASLDNVVRALNRSNGNQRWRKSTATRPTQPPIATGGDVIVVGLAPTLSNFDAKNGAPLNNFAAPAELAGEPLIDPVLRPFRVAAVLITRDGRVIGLRPYSTTYREAAPLPLTALPGRTLPRERLP
jgi:outer membrane protein assembly factor BamB